MDLLSIANTYGLKRVQSRAVPQIEDIDVTKDPVNRVLLAKQLNIKKWLGPAYVELCTRTDPIKESEAEKLGIYTYMTIVTVRDSLSKELSQRTAKDRALSVTPNLRCCGNTPSQLHDGAYGAKMCPTCQQIVISGPGIPPLFTNNNRQCCGYKLTGCSYGPDLRGYCVSCLQTVVPALVTANLNCCGNNQYSAKFKDGTNGSKLCYRCNQIIIPGPGIIDFTNDNRRCCNNPPSLWKSQPDGSQVCPSCKGIVLPLLMFPDRALAVVKKAFDLEG